MLRKSLKYNIFVFFLFTIGGLNLYAQENFVNENVKRITASVFTNSPDSVETCVKNFLLEVEKLTIISDKIAALNILALYEEANGFYSLAGEHFSECARLEKDVTAAQGFKFLAARSFILSGDVQLGSYILNNILSSAMTFDLKVKAEVYLLLCSISDETLLEKNIYALQTAIYNQRYGEYKSTLLFCLYWLTQDESVKEMLIKQFPNSIESFVVKNNATLLPVSFWYLMPRKVPSTRQEEIAEPILESNVQFETPSQYQVGFFKNKSYAENFAIELQQKGFKVFIKTETKNGEVSYQVIVNETYGETSVQNQLKNAGYEAYPVFK